MDMLTCSCVALDKAHLTIVQVGGLADVPQKNDTLSANGRIASRDTQECEYSHFSCLVFA